MKRRLTSAWSRTRPSSPTNTLRPLLRSASSLMLRKRLDTLYSELASEIANALAESSKPQPR